VVAVSRVSPAEVPVRARRSLLEFGPRTRVAFAVAYAGVMAWVIGSAQWRPDHVFGFQMFNQSSKIDIRLLRRVRGRRAPVPVVNGSWQARDARGLVHDFRWEDRVKDPVLRVLEKPVHAKYGLDGQLFRLEHALEDVLAHIPDDAETTGLVASVATLKNGRDPAVVRLEARRR
jgi:hypothetical protein